MVKTSKVLTFQLYDSPLYWNWNCRFKFQFIVISERFMQALMMMTMMMVMINLDIWFPQNDNSVKRAPMFR